jgi:hypothetical protein
MGTTRGMEFWRPRSLGRALRNEFWLACYSYVELGRESIPIPDEQLLRAVSTIESKIGDLQEGADHAPPPQLSANTKKDADSFDDEALANMFASLVSGFK